MFSGQQLSLLFPILLIFIFYFLLIRPQKKREKQINEMRKNLKVGDRIVTIGGIHGKIVKIKDEKVTIEVGSDKTKLNMARWSVSSVEQEGKGTPEKDKKKNEDKPEAIEDVKKEEMTVDTNNDENKEDKE